MKSLIVLIIAIAFSISGYSQITATTSSGKKVILNSDGTWKYADNTKIDQKPCADFHTGNVTVKNNTDKDIFFYYHYQGIFGRSPNFVKVKAKSSKTISALTSEQNTIFGKEQFRYAWKATLESQRNDISIKDMEGIESGIFVITDCESTELEVDN